MTAYAFRRLHLRKYLAFFENDESYGKAKKFQELRECIPENAKRDDNLGDWMVGGGFLNMIRQCGRKGARMMVRRT